MKKKLYMEYPPITSYPTHANLLSCLSQHDNYLVWYFENYMNIFTNNKLDKIMDNYVDFFAPIPWKSNPFLYSQSFSRELFATMETDIINFLINAINQGNYIFLYLNRFYLSAAYSYQKNDDVHDVFIYGYDNEKKIFNIADFFVNNKYSFATATFDEISWAYDKYNDDWKDGEVDIRNVDGIILVKPLPFTAYSYTVTDTLQGLKDYLCSTTSSGRYLYGYRLDCEYDEFFEVKNCFGLNIYSFLEEYLKTIDSDNPHIDLRGFYIIHEHKKLLSLYLDYLEKKWMLDVSELRNLLKPVIEETKNLYAMVLKLILTRGLDFDNVLRKIIAIRQDDTIFIRKLIDFLEYNKNHFN